MKFLFVLFLFAISFDVRAGVSNYPGDYCHQVVRVLQAGPAVFASVGSGCMRAVVFGYKKSGHLARSNLKKIDLIMVAGCRLQNQTQVERTTTVELGPEWHGTGYMSTEHSPYEFTPTECQIRGDRNSLFYRITFSDGNNNWDPGNGINHNFDTLEFFNNSGMLQTKTDGSSVNLKAWGFIVDSMKE